HNERVPVAGRTHFLEARPRAGLRPRGTLLLLHAFPLNARMWDAQLTAFADRGWRVIAPHFRGFGGGVAGSGVAAPGPLGTTSVPMGSDPVAVSAIDDYAGDVIDLLDHLHITDAVVLGLSMGGYVAFAMLRLASNYIHALVLADTRPQADTPEGASNRVRL